MQFTITKILFTFLVAGGILQPLAGQPLTKPQEGTFALINATLVTVTEDTIENGTLIIRDGKIEALGEEVDVPDEAEEIDCSGLSVYPGLIDGGTRLGLQEVGSISLTQDYNEIGDYTPQMQALTAVNPNSVAIPVTRTNGVTTVLTAPTGGPFPGTAALINLLGYTPEQMYCGFKGVVLNFPSTGPRSQYDRRSMEEIQEANKENLRELNEFWEEALFYHRLDSAAQEDPGRQFEYSEKMAAMLPVLRNEMHLLIEVDKEQDILSAIAWVDEKGLEKVIFTGVAEGWRVAEEIAEAGIPVVTGPVLQTPARTSDRYDLPYRNAGLLQQAGVKVAIRTNETANVRNLPFNAGFAATYGMGKAEALRAVTIVPAEIFGLDDRLGSLEAGKDATLFVTDGDPFETKTQVRNIFIDGYQVPLDNRHIRLYNEFLQRNPGLRK